MNKNGKCDLAFNYHESSKAAIMLDAYDPAISYKIYPNAETVSFMPNDYTASRQSDDSFLRTLLKRRSIRNFSSSAVDLGTLAKLLTLSCGLRNDDTGVKSALTQVRARDIRLKFMSWFFALMTLIWGFIITTSLIIL